MQFFPGFLGKCTVYGNLIQRKAPLEILKTHYYACAWNIQSSILIVHNRYPQCSPFGLCSQKTEFKVTYPNLGGNTSAGAAPQRTRPPQWVCAGKSPHTASKSSYTPAYTCERSEEPYSQPKDRNHERRTSITFKRVLETQAFCSLYLRDPMGRGHFSHK